MDINRVGRRLARQDGAVLVEFAIVFVLFVTLLGGLIQYGAIFAVQQSLSHAAAEATRAAVDVVDDTEAKTRALDVVEDQLEWLDVAGMTVGPSGTASCSDGVDNDADGDTDGLDTDCLRTLATEDALIQPCASPPYPAGTECLVVEITYDWAGYALVPTLLAVATPDTLSARAVIVRD